MKEEARKNSLGKEVERREEARDGELPTYQESTEAGPSTEPCTGSSTAPLGPTVSSPFNFPKEDLPPEYTPASSNHRPIAIPQRTSGSASPFLAAYPPSLLKHGITAASWYSFVDTISAFLAASVSKRAISHAVDTAASVGKVPQSFSKETINNVKEVAKGISKSAKRGNVIGVVGGVIGGTVGLTVGTATRLVGSVVSLPGTAIATAANPQTPRGRAVAYTATANKDWLNPRGLQVSLMNTAELGEVIGVSVSKILQTVNSQPAGAVEQLGALQEVIEKLEFRDNQAAINSQTRPGASAAFPVDVKTLVEDPAVEQPTGAGPSLHAASTKTVPLHLSAETLWLVVLRIAATSK